MSIKITHIRLSGGTQHEHITHLAWANDSDSAKTGSNTKADIVNWMENENGKAHTGSGASRAEVGVVVPSQGSKYLRTYADGQWNNNLLSLPHF